MGVRHAIFQEQKYYKNNLMKRIPILLLALLCNIICSSQNTPGQILQWENQAKKVTIIRDNYGVPHVYGKSDADAVFGLLYAQCEDDFKRVELNYIEKLGRLGEINGEKDLYNDLLIRLVIDSADAIRDYNNAPAWLKKLCNAFADGINYFLYKNPQIKPALLTYFQPWYPMLWTDGSIGAISTSDVSTGELKNFYSSKNEPVAIKEKQEEIITGSNGFAFSPKITQSKNAILYINPHVTFYFRPEVHIVSEEGLNAYGAVTWGQFFIYQGFNEHCGWMHTSSYADISDSYIEKIITENGKLYYAYDGQQKPVITKEIKVNYSNGDSLNSKTFKAFYTGHGPIMAKRNGAYISVKSNNRDINGLIQSWQRTKAKSFAEYKKVMDLLANTSNNTVYADGEGNIAYWHGNFIPKRDAAYDWSKPVDGTTSATEWQGLHSVNESVHIYNPANGWIQNCNSTPFTVSGTFSPKREDYPPYMAPDEESFRGVNAVRILGKEKNYTIDKVIAKGYDTYMVAFEILIPPLVKAFDGIDLNSPLYLSLKEPIKILRNWNYRSDKNSIATTLSILWGEKLQSSIYRTTLPAGELNNPVNKAQTFVKKADPEQLLNPLLIVIKELENDFGKWQIPWGDINRFQRISGDINQDYNDDSASIPVSFTSSAWGMLPSYSSKIFPGTKNRYGVNGNSFICAVEFIKKDAAGKNRVKAKSLLAGGISGHKDSKHFFDQGGMYAEGKFKDVLFYKKDLMKNVERKYHPGG